jgi:hypothetical protein
VQPRPVPAAYARRLHAHTDHMAGDSGLKQSAAPRFRGILTRWVCMRSWNSPTQAEGKIRSVNGDLPVGRAAIC